ncbi:nitrile hydratase accessory protein [Mycolicibacterium baixiangningiae]|uniref:nitrile hydratase accessory protein n=1 Tax=Mycolicibacterium baixiangningiae TaxID=2761578 RepID=UPI0018692E32|nr:nitrile hydratase accessory protein [Mycolicibacterium baixiangningiae]
MTADLDTEGAAAPPRANGELVFDEPWESRAFGMAVLLVEAGVFTWPQFRTALVARIAHWQSRDDGQGWHYYQHWLGALEDVLTAGGTVSTDHVASRASALALRPDGHDHRH